MGTTKKLWDLVVTYGKNIHISKPNSKALKSEPIDLVMWNVLKPSFSAVKETVEWSERVKKGIELDFKEVKKDSKYEMFGAMFESSNEHHNFLIQHRRIVTKYKAELVRGQKIGPNISKERGFSNQR